MTLSPVTFATHLGLIVLSIAIVLSIIRIALGPTLADRVVALDLMAILVICILVVYGIAEAQPESLRVATVLALVNFLGTIGFAIYLQRKSRNE